MNSEPDFRHCRLAEKFQFASSLRFNLLRRSLQFLAFLFLPWITLSAENSYESDLFDIEQYTPLFDTESAPSSIVGGVVNVISGRYFEHDTDYVSPSANPICIERSYNSGAVKEGYLHGFGELNVAGRMCLSHKHGKFQVDARDRGSRLFYESDLKDKNELIFVHPELLKEGVCNTAPPTCASRFSLTRNYYKATNKGLSINSGYEKAYFRLWDADYYRYLTNVTFGTGCSHHYFYDKNFRVNRMESLDSEGQKLAGIKLIEHPPQGPNKERRLEIISDEGQKVTYHLSPYEGSGKYISYSVSAVEKSFSPSIQYKYVTREKNKPQLLTKKIYPDGRFLQVNYVNYRNQDRVRVLRAPAGCNQTAHPIYTFEYDKRKASVWDANGNKKIYYWKDNQRLNTVQHYMSDGKLYRSEEIRWGAYEGYKDPTHLRARHLVDAKGRIHMSRRFFNNKYGRVVKDVLYGNLSGIGRYRYDMHDQKEEKYIKEYTYFGCLVETETIGVDRGKFQQRTQYKYYKGTSQIQSKLVSDQEGVRERYFYEYAACGVPVLEIVDDGQANLVDSLKGVTQRTIKRVKLTDRGLPCEEIHAYLDLDTQNEIQLSRVVNHYSPFGKVVQKDYYDADDNYAYSESWKYNSYGQVTEEVDRAGRITFANYDANGNCIYKAVPHHEVETYYTYDYSNRLIKEEVLHQDGRRFIKSYAYDLKGNRIKEIDSQGNETLYIYDEFDRLVEKILVAVADEQGELISGSEKYTYDVLDHLTSQTAPDGTVTQISTNFYGKPTRVIHPDKTVEKAIYYYDGTVKCTFDSQKVMTWYEYDYKKRKVLEKKLSPTKECLSEKTWKYSAFNLIEEVDAEGIATTYSYDGAGRITAKRRDREETLYFYDAWGREKAKWEKCGESSYRVTIREYDIFGQTIEERIEDESGNLFLLKEFAYDAWGNVVNEAVYNQGELSQTISQYNSSGQLIKKIMPDGSETVFHYENDFINALGQTVKTEIVIDPKGNAVYKIYDAREKISVEEKKNVYSETVQRAEYLYDQKGRLITKKENVIVSGEVLRVHCTAFEYDCRGKEIAVIEAKGEPEQKITRRTYTSFGEVEEILRPSGILLTHHYDFLGRLSTLSSSDGSIDYAYAYDGNHNIVSVEDHVANAKTSRTYDSSGNILSETMAHGAVMDYAYDPLNRLIETTLPDSSTISYGYDAGYLREVRRGRYVHRDDYDISGKREASELAGSVGTVTYLYDSCLRPEVVFSPYHGMELAFDPIGNVVEADYYDVKGEIGYRYGYDDLNQLTSDNFHTYQFDSLGNRVAYDGQDTVHNALNQLLQQGEIHCQYDDNGNLTRKNGRKFFYDALDRMTEVVKGDVKTAYLYDPFHRRLVKTQYRLQEDVWVEVAKERYLYQSDKEIGVIESDGTLQQLRVMGVGVGGEVGAAVLMELDGRTYVPLHDWRGNVAGLVDVQSKEVVESYRFDAFGVETVDDPINPWRFSSKRVDPETGFSYFGARYYDPEVGRWTTPDPMWFVDGTHLYCYVRNNPAMFIDPEGLFLAAICQFLWESFKAIYEFAAEYCDIELEGYGTLHVNINGQSPSMDHRSGIMHPSDGRYGSVHVTTINGIENDVYESADFYSYISGMSGGCSSSFVYNASHRAIWDLAECAMNLLGFSTRPEALLHREWNNFFSNCPDDNSILIMTCHSQGAILTRNALASYDTELRKRIHVIAIAPGAYIDESTCGSVLHFVSKRDIVPLFDVFGRRRNDHTIQYLEPHPNAPYFDHKAKSPTYKSSIENRIDWIKDNYAR